MVDGDSSWSKGVAEWKKQMVMLDEWLMNGSCMGRHTEAYATIARTRPTVIRLY